MVKEDKYDLKALKEDIGRVKKTVITRAVLKKGEFILNGRIFTENLTVGD